MFRGTKNLQNNARKVRMSVGIILLVFGLFALTDLLRAVVIIIATYGMITGMVGYCPASEMLTSSSRVKHSITHHKKHHHR